MGEGVGEGRGGREEGEGIGARERNREGREIGREGRGRTLTSTRLSDSWVQEFLCY